MYFEEIFHAQTADVFSVGNCFCNKVLGEMVKDVFCVRTVKGKKHQEPSNLDIMSCDSV